LVGCLLRLAIESLICVSIVTAPDPTRIDLPSLWNPNTPSPRKCVLACVLFNRSDRHRFARTRCPRHLVRALTRCRLLWIFLPPSTTGRDAWHPALVLFSNEHPLLSPPISPSVPSSPLLWPRRSATQQACMHHRFCSRVFCACSLVFNPSHRCCGVINGITLGMNASAAAGCRQIRNSLAPRSW